MLVWRCEDFSRGLIMEIFIENIFRDIKNLFRDMGISTEK